MSTSALQFYPILPMNARMLFLDHGSMIYFISYYYELLSLKKWTWDKFSVFFILYPLELLLSHLNIFELNTGELQNSHKHLMGPNWKSKSGFVYVSHDSFSYMYHMVEGRFFSWEQSCVKDINRLSTADNSMPLPNQRKH